MAKIYKVKKPTRNEVQSWYILSDIHDKHYHKPTVDIMMKMAKQNKNWKGLIINGDLLDMEEFMKSKNPDYKRNLKNQFSIEDYFIPAFEKSMKWGNTFLDVIVSEFDEVIYLLGNHEVRVTEFLKADCPAEYRHNFSFEKGLHLQERGIKLIQYNDFVEIGGRVMVTHGVYHGTSAVKNHTAVTGKTTLFGYVHQYELKSFRQVGDTIVGISLPCACSMNPYYMRNKPNNWTNGFAIVHINRKYYYIDVKTIWDDTLIGESGKVI